MSLTTQTPLSNGTQPVAPSSSHDSDDHEIISEVEKTHHPDGSKIDAKLLLGIIQNILPFSNRCVNLLTGTEKRDVLLKEMINLSDPHVMLADQANIIDKLCCEIACQCSSKGGAAVITIDLFKGALSKFSWDAKLVLMVAAFAVYYGEFGLLNLLHTSNGFATNIAFLRRLPNIIKDADILKTLFVAITKLVEAILEVTILVVQFNDLPSGFVEPHEEPLSSANAEIKRVVYWTVLSIVNCALAIAELGGLRNEFTIKKVAWELSSFVNRIITKVDLLKSLFQQCKDEIEARKAYLNLVEIFKVTTHQDNLEVLKVLFYLKDDRLPFVIGNNNKEVEDINNILKHKEVLLLLTSLDGSEKEIIEQLVELYKEPHTNLGSQYHIVWIPITDKPDDETFKQLQSLMPWYTVYSLEVIRPEARKYIREVYKFTKTLLLHFDSHGTVQSENVLDMIHVWGTSTFPLNDDNFSSLIENKPFTADLLLEGIYSIDTTMSIRCIYGGEDIHWIKKLKTLAEKIVVITGISLELVYINKSKDIDEELKPIFHGPKQNLKSTLWSEPKAISQFWNRLESIFKLKIKTGKIENIEDDNTIIDIITILSYSSSYEGWAVFAESGSTKMAKATGKVVLQALSRLIDEWKDHHDKGFIDTLNIFISGILTPAKHCNHISLPPSTAEIVGDKMKCVICHRPMEKHQLMYRCCTE